MLAYRISKSICKFVRFTQNRSLRLENYQYKPRQNEQKVYRDNNFIQRNAKFGVRSKKRANFLRVRKPRNIIFHASAVVYLRKLCSFALKILKVIWINAKLSVEQYFKDISALKNCIYRAMELSKCRKASALEVSKFGFHFLAVIRIALENRRVVHSKALFVPFKSVMSIFFGSEYSFTYLLVILSSIRSISTEKGASEIISVYGPQLPSTVHNFRTQLRGGGGTRYIKKVGMLVENFEIDP